MKLFKILFITVLLTSFNLAFAGDPFIPDDIPMKPIKNRPSDTSSDVNLHCIYMQGQLRFRFDVPEDKATLTVTCFETGEVIRQKNMETKAMKTSTLLKRFTF